MLWYAWEGLGLRYPFEWAEIGWDLELGMWGMSIYLGHWSQLQENIYFCTVYTFINISLYYYDKPFFT